jgi:cholesterol transport system auxiliary component
MSVGRGFAARWAVLGLVAALGAGSGCALFSRGASVDMHWYTPELASSSTGRAEVQGGCALRLARVAAGSDLGRRIAYGDGLYQVGYYETLRWTEHPEAYVRRALGRALFEEGPFERAVSPSAPSLDVEVLAFQEIRAPETHAARVALRIVLSADRALLERTVTVNEPFPGEPFDAFVAAMSVALRTAANEVVRDVAVACAPTGS